jgi:hypothetical protein
LRGSRSKRHLHFFKESFPFRTRKTNDEPREIACDRMSATANRNRFELRGQKYLDDVARWYRDFAEEENGTQIIDASRSITTGVEVGRLQMFLCENSSY